MTTPEQFLPARRRRQILDDETLETFAPNPHPPASETRDANLRENGNTLVENTRVEKAWGEKAWVKDFIGRVTGAIRNIGGKR